MKHQKESCTGITFKKEIKKSKEIKKFKNKGERVVLYCIVDCHIKIHASLLHLDIFAKIHL